MLSLRALPASNAPLRVSAVLVKDGRRCGKLEADLQLMTEEDGTLTPTGSGAGVAAE